VARDTEPGNYRVSSFGLPTCDGCEADLAAFEPLTAPRGWKKRGGARSRYRGGRLEHLEMRCVGTWLP
jgi:hypothetical protein